MKKRKEIVLSEKEAIVRCLETLAAMSGAFDSTLQENVKWQESMPLK